VTLAVVTGASRGIGRATALALGARGVELALVGRPSREQDETASLARAAGAPAATVHACDLAVASEVERVARALSTLVPAPLVLVNNAGVAPRLDVTNVGSISATQGTARLSAYCASKWGVVGFTKSLAAELTDSGVTAVCVLPGSTSTRMLEGSGFPARMTAEDVAKTLVHFALDAPAAHNGAVIEMFGT
jgi:3-oxoacyl-[acyl-carrier protein] reductase